MIQIKTYFSDWKEVDRETAITFIKHCKDGATNIPEDKIIEYIEQNRLRGIKVLDLCPDLFKKLNSNKEQANKVDTNTPKQNKREETNEIPLDEMTVEQRQNLNQYIRESNKLNLLKSIKRDMLICELEGWDKKEYLKDIKETINSINI